MAVSYAMLDGWKVSIDAVKADFKAAADSLLSEDNVLKGASIGTPSAYGGKWVYWILYRITTQGQCEWSERYMPGIINCQVITLIPATRPASSPQQGGQAHAEEQALNGFALWIDRLWDQEAVLGRAQSVSVNATAAGSYDEFGRAMFVDTQGNVLWAHSGDVQVTL